MVIIIAKRRKEVEIYIKLRFHFLLIDIYMPREKTGSLLIVKEIIPNGVILSGASTGPQYEQIK
jgi:hypothetical protein